MSILVKYLKQDDKMQWDNFVLNQVDANLYHLSGWKMVIEKSYGHKTYYLMATKDPCPGLVNQSSIKGVLPLVHMKNPVFGNKLVSIPFFDMAGILAVDDQAASALLDEAISLGFKLKAQTIELRHSQPHPLFDGNKSANMLNLEEKDLRIQRIKDSRMSNQIGKEDFKDLSFLKLHLKHTKLNVGYVTKSHKVRMLLSLPDNAQELMKSFKAKLRSQIKKPIKEGLSAQIGGRELLSDFYDVFCINMRDLGSPVHSKKIISKLFAIFPKKARIVCIFHDKTPIAASVIVGFRNVLENPWASALRKYSRKAPNMLLYWKMLEYACEKGYSFFDFGRSSPDEGTYKFKKQWGAIPYPLYWNSISLNRSTIHLSEIDKPKFNRVIQYWQKLPVPVSRFLGPMVRKHIAL